MPAGKRRSITVCMFASSYQRRQSWNEHIFITDFLSVSGQEAGTPESNVPKELEALLHVLREQGSKPELETALPRVDATGREEPVTAQSFLLESGLC